MIKIGGNYPVTRPCVNATVVLVRNVGWHSGKPVAGDPTISIFPENYLTELSLLAKRHFPEARTEATTETFEDEDGRVRVYPPAGLREEEIAAIEGKLADRCVDILIERGVFICSAVYD
jgi:hypothetical protein